MESTKAIEFSNLFSSNKFIDRNLAAVPPNCAVVTPTNLSCSMGETLKSTPRETKHLFLDIEMSDLIAGEQSNPEEFIFTIEATAVSHLVQPAKVRKILMIRAQADIAVSGARDTMQFYSTNPAQIFSHTYNVSWLERKMADNKVVIYVASGKHPVYVLMHVHTFERLH